MEDWMLIYLPVTSRPLISLQEEAVLSPCNFATAHLTAGILNFYLPLNFATHETEDPFAAPQNLSAPKSQRFLRFAIAIPIADPRNRSDFGDKRKQCCIAISGWGAMESR